MAQHDPIKVYDARWETDEFSPDEITRFIESVYIYGRKLGADTVTVTRDARLGAGEVMEKAVSIGINAGFTVFLCTDPVSTPLSYYFSMETSIKYPNTMGLTITASHNPKEYIGLKVTVPTVQAIGLDSGPLGGFTKIREIYYSNEKLNLKLVGSPSRRRKLFILNPVEEYINFSMEKAGVKPGSLSGINVVLNSFNGSAGPELYRAYKSAGINVYPLMLIPDGNFPAGAPNPISRGKMDSAVSKAGELKGSVAIGTDGDGDRVVFGDYRGTLNAGFASLPVLKALLKLQQPAGGQNLVIYDPKVSPLALLEWKNLGIKPYLFRNGHSQIKDYMHKIGAMAAVEESGHFYHTLSLNNLTMYGENSVVTTLLFLKALKSNPSLIDSLWELQGSVFSTGEFNFKFRNNSIRDRALKDMTDSLSRGKNVKTASYTKEGIDLQGTVITSGLNLGSSGSESKKLTGTWYSGYFRSSTNEKAVLRAYISASDPAIGEELEKKAIHIARQYDGVEAE
ncbi:MAG: hypothetical protein J7K04_12975 [Spirochaetales bacterium]|nr:hypothetical protein [Spirochaetales bacterium]